ncbi:hypothetical protein CRG98_046906 [Punica granatum]|uniref:non-specific serine/threonine protein kinase n=1 Tax=Punica granatum TaxID=22663 RepID=A0A2I0HLU1_PUNGR|nr:hypothetical protein CRG98_046906 [Punica granatum]
MRNGTILLFDLRVLFLPALVILLMCCCSEETVASTNPIYEACMDPSPCGNVSVKYPFWTHNDFCGHRGFQIDCKGSKPFFNLIFGRYHVQTLNTWVVFLDLQTHADFNARCLPDFHYSPNSSTIRVSQDETNVRILVSFFYNCSSIFSLDHALPLTCSNDTHQSYVALERKNITHDSEDPTYDPQERACESQFFTIIELEGKDFDHETKTIKYKGFLEDNIVLKWPTNIYENCKKCQRSGGRCGRSVSEEDRFQCFCSDRSEPESCEDLSIFLVPTLINENVAVKYDKFFTEYRCRCRRMHASLTVLSENNSAENSLMSELAGTRVYFEVPIFQNKELEEATNNFDSSQELGDGGFGTVYYAPQGTPGYVDPEYYQCYQLTEKSDVYSFGVVLVELLSSMPAVDISRERHEINLANLAINRIQKHAYGELIDPRLGFDSDVGIREMITKVAELAFLCLQQEKEMRPTMVAVVEELKLRQLQVEQKLPI